MLRYIYTNGKNTDFAALCLELDQSLNQQVGGEENWQEYIKYNNLTDIQNVIIAYEEDTPIGCASFKHWAEGAAEVKRVFLHPQRRGSGVAAEMMKLLEQKAREQGYHTLVLETGKAMVAAIAFYRKLGYSVIPNYGPYENMDDSVCMKKQL